MIYAIAVSFSGWKVSQKLLPIRILLSQISYGSYMPALQENQIRQNSC
jgi:hypothetical protein